MTNGPDPAEAFAALFAAQLDTTASRIARHLAGQTDHVEAGRLVPDEPRKPQRAVDPSQAMGDGNHIPTDNEIAQQYFSAVILEKLGPSGMIKDPPPDFNIFN